MQRHHLVVIIGHCVGTAAVGGNDARPDDSHQHFFPLLWQLQTMKGQKDDVKMYVCWRCLITLELKRGLMKHVPADFSQNYNCVILITLCNTRIDIWLLKISRGSHLRFISDDDVILHRVGNVVNAEFKIGTFRNIHKTNASPSRGSVLRVCSRDNGHTLQRDGEIIGSTIGSNEDFDKWE